MIATLAGTPSRAVALGDAEAARVVHDAIARLPQSSLTAGAFYQMNVEGTVSSQTFSRDPSCLNFAFNSSAVPW
ncbi:hypothetical protein [Sorangium sp. So ce1099]|uniref:hypothetical protein n=1 Tax=Sorangium sp. So ce1099 TaxID=3133331 RepID=UPI003F5F740B